MVGCLFGLVCLVCLFGLFVCLVGWLFGLFWFGLVWFGLVGCLVGLLVGWLVAGWLFGLLLFGLFIYLFVGCLVISRLVGLVCPCFQYFFNDFLSVYSSLFHLPAERLRWSGSTVA